MSEADRHRPRSRAPQKWFLFKVSFAVFCGAVLVDFHTILDGSMDTGDHPTMNFGDFLAKSPSFAEDRRQWNAVWERDLAKIFGSGVEIYSALEMKSSITDGFPAEFYDELLTDSGVASMHSWTSHICSLQHSLSLKSLQRFVEDDFETRWMLGCSPKEREEFILEGLVRTCELSAYYESYRQWCPELSLERLNRDSGRGFIELLEQLYQVPEEYRTVPNAVFEKIIGINGPNTHRGRVYFQTFLEVRRTYFLTWVVWQVLLVIYGESQEYGFNKKQRGGTNHWKKLLKYLPPDVNLKAEVKGALQEAELRDSRKFGERHCAACRLPARLAGVETLLACQRCKSIGRLVWYCSRECQTTDWRKGKPPHKTICGKKGAFIEAFISSTTTHPHDHVE
ncbi:hypothetical protein C8J57DRAFT_118138 [Mycena rebaudengoi]|nr:hypothetical protein C8J57DRAFT_118138 [Mycena rebaudengoi]